MQIWSKINYPHYPGIYLWVPGTKMRQENPGIWVPQVPGINHYTIYMDLLGSPGSPCYWNRLLCSACNSLQLFPFIDKQQQQKQQQNSIAGTRYTIHVHFVYLVQYQCHHVCMWDQESGENYTFCAISRNLCCYIQKLRIEYIIYKYR